MVQLTSPNFKQNAARAIADPGLQKALGTAKGAFLHNVMPLIAEAEHGTFYGVMGQRSPEPEELPGELADVMLYLLQLARVTGIDLEEAVLRKIEINYARTWDDSSLNSVNAREMA